jgi:hypothetical protein
MLDIKNDYEHLSEPKLTSINKVDKKLLEEFVM